MDDYDRRAALRRTVEASAAMRLSVDQHARTSKASAHSDSDSDDDDVVIVVPRASSVNARRRKGSTNSPNTNSPKSPSTPVDAEHVSSTPPATTTKVDESKPERTSPKPQKSINSAFVFDTDTIFE